MPLTILQVLNFIISYLGSNCANVNQYLCRQTSQRNALISACQNVLGRGQGPGPGSATESATTSSSFPIVAEHSTTINKFSCVSPEISSGKDRSVHCEDASPRDVESNHLGIEAPNPSHRPDSTTAIHITAHEEEDFMDDQAPSELNAGLELRSPTSQANPEERQDHGTQSSQNSLKPPFPHSNSVSKSPISRRRSRSTNNRLSLSTSSPSKGLRLQPSTKQGKSAGYGRLADNLVLSSILAAKVDRIGGGEAILNLKHFLQDLRNGLPPQWQHGTQSTDQPPDQIEDTSPLACKLQALKTAIEINEANEYRLKCVRRYNLAQLVREYFKAQADMEDRAECLRVCSLTRSKRRRVAEKVTGKPAKRLASSVLACFVDNLFPETVDSDRPGATDKKKKNRKEAVQRFNNWKRLGKPWLERSVGHALVIPGPETSPLLGPKQAASRRKASPNPNLSNSSPLLCVD